MSADNYYYITNNPQGKGFVVIMGFESDDNLPSPCVGDSIFSTLSKAFYWAQQQYSEYGVRVDPALADQLFRDEILIDNTIANGAWCQVCEMFYIDGDIYDSEECGHVAPNRISATVVPQ